MNKIIQPYIWIHIFIYPLLIFFATLFFEKSTNFSIFLFGILVLYAFIFIALGFVKNTYKTLPLLLIVYVFILFLRDIVSDYDYYITEEYHLIFILGNIIAPLSFSFTKFKLNKPQLVKLIKTFSFIFMVLIISRIIKFGFSDLRGIDNEAAASSTLQIGYLSALLFNANLLLARDTKKSKLYTYAFQILMISATLIAIFLSQSRGPTIALIIGFVIVVLRKNKFMVIFASVLVMIFLNLSDLSSLGRISSIFSADFYTGGYNNESRVVLYELAIKDFKSSFLFGNSFEITGLEGYSHNFIIDILHIGGISFLIIVLAFFYVSYKYFTNINDERIKSFLLLIFIVGFVSAQFSGVLHTNYLLWIALSAPFALNTENQKKLSAMKAP
jgi:hypothetical protein